METMDLPRVLYVGGPGRSGSTLLERAMAQIPGVCGVGEVIYLWERGIVNNERCGCGDPFWACAFWTAVGQKAFGGWDKVNVERVLSLSSRVDDVKYVPRMLFPIRSGRFRADLNEYLDYYMRLYAAIRSISECDVVVDSSKATSFAYALSHSDDLQLSMVHIIRDPRAVAYSWTKRVKRPEVTSGDVYMPQFSPGYVAALYDGHHMLLEMLRARRVPCLRVRYEDFAEHPESTLRAVAQLLGREFDPSDVVREASGGQISLRLPRTHSVSGNPSRFSTGHVVMRRDEAWRKDMRHRDQLLVGAITAPLQATYGYLGGAARATPRRSPSEGPNV